MISNKQARLSKKGMMLIRDEEQKKEQYKWKRKEIQ
jgi:hypothetical protein